MTDIYDHPEYQAMLAGIRAVPDDDLPRLVLADWLEEHGEAERAEFVRVQCELAKTAGFIQSNTDQTRWVCDSCGSWESDWHRDWCRFSRLWRRELELWDAHHRKWFTPARHHVTIDREQFGRINRPVAMVERGFVAEVRGPLSVLHGGECGRCEGDGVSMVADYHRWKSCKHCHGTGRTPGVLSQLLRREPVSADGIEVVGVTPHENADGTYSWWIAEESAVPDQADLPGDVWDALDKPPRGMIAAPTSRYPTPDAARLALGAALYRIHAPQEVTT